MVSLRSRRIRHPTHADTIVFKESSSKTHYNVRCEFVLRDSRFGMSQVPGLGVVTDKQTPSTLHVFSSPLTDLHQLLNPLTSTEDGERQINGMYMASYIGLEPRLHQLPSDHENEAHKRSQSFRMGKLSNGGRSHKSAIIADITGTTQQRTQQPWIGHRQRYLQNRGIL